MGGAVSLTSDAEPQSVELLPVFAIHAELARSPGTGLLDSFAQNVERDIRVAAAKGSLEQLNQTLRMWLWIALAVQDLKRGFGDLDEVAQQARGDYLVERWLKKHAT